MFTVLLLTTLLGAADQQAPAATAVKPEDLAQAGNFKEALEGFRRRAAADSRDLDARVWIAWLHEQMGRPDLAEPVYRSVVLEAPGDVDVALRFAVFITKRHPEEAVRVLERAKSSDPMNRELLTALGNAHLRVSNTELGRAYLEMAAALSPESAKPAKRTNSKSSTPAPVVGGGS